MHLQLSVLIVDTAYRIFNPLYHFLRVFFLIVRESLYDSSCKISFFIYAFFIFIIYFCFARNMLLTLILDKRIKIGVLEWKIIRILREEREKKWGKYLEFLFASFAHYEVGRSFE